MLASVMIMSVPVYSKPSKTRANRESHDQKYTLKRRKKAGGVYNKRKKVERKCFWLLGIRYCQTKHKA